MLPNSTSSQDQRTPSCTSGPSRPGSQDTSRTQHHRSNLQKVPGIGDTTGTPARIAPPSRCPHLVGISTCSHLNGTPDARVSIFPLAVREGEQSPMRPITLSHQNLLHTHPMRGSLWSGRPIIIAKSSRVTVISPKGRWRLCISIL